MGGAASVVVDAEAARPLDASDVDGESAVAEVMRLRQLLHEVRTAGGAEAKKGGGGAGGASAQMTKLLQQRSNWDAERVKFYAWLASVPEDALEPELEIVDPHHHLWDMRDFLAFNPWGIFKQKYYMTDELVDDMVGGGHNITHTVFVSTHAFFDADGAKEAPVMAPLGEVQFVQGVAAQFRSCKYGPFRGAAGIIGAANLVEHGAAVEPLLVACKRASPNYRGIRENAAHDPAVKGNFASKPGMYREPKFREGFALLEKHDLVFDAWLFSSQLPDLHDLASAFPRTTIILNHMGTPVAGLGNVSEAPGMDGKQDEILAQWKADLTRIASDCPNVVVKVGGAGLPFLGHGFEARDRPPTSEEVAETFGDLFRWTIATFGAARCMLEGNFPVDKVCMSYTVLWNALKRITKDMPADDRALLFSGTAKRIYRL